MNLPSSPIILQGYNCSLLEEHPINLLNKHSPIIINLQFKSKFKYDLTCRTPLRINDTYCKGQL